MTTFGEPTLMTSCQNCKKQYKTNRELREQLTQANERIAELEDILKLLCLAHVSNKPNKFYREAGIVLERVAKEALQQSGKELKERKG